MEAREKMEEAILINSFRTKRLDGHSVKTIYALTQKGIVSIERRIVSTELNDGFILIRKFGKYFYQYERMIFKLESFVTISKTIAENVSKLDLDNILKAKDIIFSPNERKIIKIYKTYEQDENSNAISNRTL